KPAPDECGVLRSGVGAYQAGQNSPARSTGAAQLCHISGACRTARRTAGALRRTRHRVQNPLPDSALLPAGIAPSWIQTGRLSGDRSSCRYDDHVARASVPVARSAFVCRRQHRGILSILRVTEVWRIPYGNPGAQFAEERADLMPRIEAILAGGMHVGGPEIEALEREIADYVGTRHAVALGSGTDALILGMIAAGIGPGDEVITPPNSFVASTAAIPRAGATPVFTDVRRDGLIDPDAVAAAVTSRTAAVMPVHLWGGICDMEALWAIAERHGLAIVEDAAQAMGTRYRNRRAGSLGTVG